MLSDPKAFGRLAARICTAGAARIRPQRTLTPLRRITPVNALRIGTGRSDSCCLECVERRCGRAARLRAIGQQVLAVRVGNVEPVPVQVQLADDGVPYMDHAWPVADVGLGPFVAEIITAH